MWAIYTAATLLRFGTLSMDENISLVSFCAAAVLKGYVWESSWKSDVFKWYFQVLPTLVRPDNPT